MDGPVIGVLTSGVTTGLRLASAARQQRELPVRSIARDAVETDALAGLIVDVPLQQRPELIASLTRTWRVPMLVESPVAADLERGRSIAGLSDDTTLVSANPLRYGLHTRRLIDEIGQREDPLETFFVAWRCRAGSATQPVLPQLLDPIRRISAVDRDEPSVLIATLRYASGVIGSLEVGRHLPGNLLVRSELVIECFSSEHAYHCVPGHQSVSVYGAFQGSYDWQPEPAEAIVASFAGWLRGGPRPFGSIGDDLTALALTDRIHEAARTHAVINLAEG